MAFLKSPSSVVVLIMVMLLVTPQPAYSKRRLKGSRICKAKCYMTCLQGLFKRDYFAPCLLACFITRCRAKDTRSHPSFHCGVGCVKSTCFNPGDGNGNGKVSEECVTSCVNNCDEKSVGDLY